MILTYVAFRCDNVQAGRQCQRRTPPRRSMVNAAKYALRDGWVRDRERLYCPFHAAQLRQPMSALELVPGHAQIPLPVPGVCRCDIYPESCPEHPPF